MVYDHSKIPEKSLKAGFASNRKGFTRYKNCAYFITKIKIMYIVHEKKFYSAQVNTHMEIGGNG